MITKKISKKSLVISVLTGFFVIFFLTLYIWHQAESVRIGYDTKDLENRIDHLNGEIEKLELEKADLLSLDTVEQMARQELGMVDPGPHQIIFERESDRQWNRRP